MCVAINHSCCEWPCIEFISTLLAVVYTVCSLYTSHTYSCFEHFPHLQSGIFVAVTHNLELPTERTLPSSLSTSTPVQSPVTTSTGLVHPLRYGFIIFVLSYSVTLLDVRPEAPVHNWCVSGYLCRDCVRHYC